MNHVSFGSTLKEARIAKGYDIATVARRLRIRPDILQAIEASDFERMPPRGYARNMINAYARMLGLDPGYITGMYLDESYANQITNAHDDSIQQRYNQRNTSVATSRPSRSSMLSNEEERASRNAAYSRDYHRSPNGEEVNFLGRRTYALENDDKISGSRERYHQQRSQVPLATTHPRRSTRTTIDDGYYNAVAGKSSFDVKSKLPLIIGCIIVLILLFVVLNLTVCHKQDSSENIPVTGANTSQTSNSSNESEQTQAVTETAPTSFTLEYSISSGTTCYVEIYVDGKTEVASDLKGPKSGSYTSSDTIKFVSVGTEGVTVKIDGVEQTLEENSKGICSKTYKFSEILEQWYADHPNAQGASSATTNSSNSSSNSSSKTSTNSKNSSNSSAKTKNNSSN